VFPSAVPPARPLPATSPVCDEKAAQFRVLLLEGGSRPGRLKLFVSARNDGEPKRERDAIRFRCLPPA
jgi:hypothetical protein